MHVESEHVLLDEYYMFKMYSWVLFFVFQIVYFISSNTFS